MEIGRRRILQGMLALGAVLVTPVRWLLARVRTHPVPGPVRPLDPEAVAKPGRWGG